eukprot:Nitzschia sp. Nitz4//scaffold34_size148208//5081//5698//NITZ4_002955-RA/size148208-processed-gene-0.0-mRNA-1//1//CDS//3329548720//8693//frame0
MFRWSLFLWSVCLLPTSVDSFASWLKCYVDLDPTEVVMFHKMIDADHAKHDMRIEVQPMNGTISAAWAEAAMEGTWLSTSDSVLSLPAMGSADDEDMTLLVRLHLPSSLDALQADDLQYVVEVQTPNQDEDESEDPSSEFVKRHTMCDGSRAFSSGGNDPVVLKIDPRQPVELRAGWALGVEAVALTPPLTLRAEKVGGGSAEEL